jgi:heme/copper-type cytochrome/quinol oxidase subunit 2
MRSHLPNPIGTVPLAIVATVAFVALGLLLAACGDDDEGASAEEIQSVEDIVTQVFESSPDDADFLFEHVTDNLLETVFFTSREDCAANAEECIGEPSAVESISGTAIDGDTATTTVVSDFGPSEVGLVRADGVWMVDSLQAGSDELPEGVVSIDLTLAEFAFVFDDAEIPSDGNIAFHASNMGVQAHEVVVIDIPEGTELEEAIESVGAEEVPPLGFKVYIQPGQKVDMAPDAPLEPGHYALICFFPDTSDPEFAPHIEKGMVKEFAIE